MPKEDLVSIKNKGFISVRYESRLISGVIERKTFIKVDNDVIYNYGLFENDYKKDKYKFYNQENIESDNCDFVISGNTLLQYTGKDKVVIIPEGIEILESGCFWDNQIIEEVILPNSLQNLGGDTFYCCSNLKKIKITSNVKQMGNNPFAGCPKLHIVNESLHFNYKDGVLFTSDMKRLIYYSMSNTLCKYHIPNGVRIVGKHAFYLCQSLEEVILPQSIIKMENNPFSGCDRLNLISETDYYHIVDKVIYNKNHTAVIGSLNSIETECLSILPVKRIERNSFWNCKGIKKIIFPNTLEDIGYNPFVGCSNIHFESQTNKFIVEDDILYNETKSKIICYPSWKAIGEIFIKDSVIELE
ncbi:MAG: leucine-rich repeat domain-containing protein, partial [Anaeroplasmataceae bacterium]|nr:leucine-rich repeat domain-containing protein [Anaeroplasmataceae bacterium]